MILNYGIGYGVYPISDVVRGRDEGRKVRRTPHTRYRVRIFGMLTLYNIDNRDVTERVFENHSIPVLDDIYRPVERGDSTRLYWH